MNTIQKPIIETTIENTLIRIALVELNGLAVLYVEERTYTSMPRVVAYHQSF